jgi:hypothetical protein
MMAISLRYLRSEVLALTLTFLLPLAISSPIKIRVRWDLHEGEIQRLGAKSLNISHGHPDKSVGECQKFNHIYKFKGNRK